MNTNPELKLNYHQSPAHGWIEIPEMLLQRLGVLKMISEYSYYCVETSRYFIEEDGDSKIVMEALKLRGITPVLVDVMYDNEPWFTKCARVGQK
jgi:hypothetical protein